MSNTDFKHLTFLAETHWGLSHLKEFLYQPDLGLWRFPSPERCSVFYHGIKSHLENDEQVTNLLDLHLFTEALIHKDQAAQWFLPWVREHIHVDRFLPEIPWPGCVNGHWSAVPVFFVHERACLRYFIVGLVSASNEPLLWPNWAEPLMDESTKRGIISAEKACRNLYSDECTRRLIVYPLAVDNQMIQFREASLGLPIALGFMALLSGKRICDELAATGSVWRDGAVERVRGLSRKITHAQNKGFRVFFLPADNNGAFEAGPMTLVPIEDLKQAWMFANLYSPGRSAELLLMKSMLKDPVSFINNCHRVPLEWLEWTRKNPMSLGTVDLISTSPDLFDLFVERLGVCLDNGDLERGEALSKLVVPSSVDNLMDAATSALFKWYTLNLSMANHRGDIQGADMWQKKALTMVKNASMRDAESFAAFYNHTFICLHHNRYDFSPELPPFLKEILSALEGQHRFQCELVNNATNETLGALYGSVAQNYGFCGPEYLAETRKYAQFCSEGYGDDKNRQMRSHRLRPLNYMVYACLDAGCPDEAEAILLAYLEMDEWQDLEGSIPRFSPWHHAALARFFAAVRKRREMAEYAAWALKNRRPLIERKHPWQLWLNNMGRVFYKLGDRQNAGEFFKESLNMCLSTEMGPTVRVMGLLPLSGLWEISAMEGLEVDGAKEVIRVSAKSLNANHFRPFLEQPDLTVILRTLWLHPEVLFPFTYR